MSLDTLYSPTPEEVVKGILKTEERSSRQGRSRKTLRPVIEHDGRVWVAYYEGRGNRFFAASQKEVLKNLQAGAQ
jgi:hypothetical protein